MYDTNTSVHFDKFDRYGEWAMVMLGESILSLLIVNDVTEDRTYSRKYYSAFYAGILSVVLLSLLFYTSQPDIPDHHAMRRTRLSGYLYTWIMQLFSASLIIVGVCYKMILTEYTEEYVNKSQKDTTSSGYHERTLAAEDSYSSSSYSYSSYTLDRQTKIVTIFGMAMGFTFVCLDILLFLHSGFVSFEKRCQCPHTGRKRYIVPGLLGFSRIVVIVFMMTSGVYYPFLGKYSEPYVIAWFGFIAILLQVSTLWILFTQ